MANRKTITAKKRLKVLQRDNFTCQSCGKSPALYPELEIDAFLKLEVDHYKPHSKKGSDDIDNLQTLCIFCNRGKGSDEHLNQTIQDKINTLLDTINPEIIKDINSNSEARIVANDTDYQELVRLNNLCSTYDIQVIPNTIFGYHAMYNAGIYTINDNNAGKVNFVLSSK
jgi:hypothetical protein